MRDITTQTRRTRAAAREIVHRAWHVDKPEVDEHRADVELAARKRRREIRALAASSEGLPLTRATSRWTAGKKKRVSLPATPWDGEKT